VTIRAVRRVELLLDRLAARAGAARLVSATAVVLAALVLLGFAIVAGTSGVHPEAWGAAAGLAILVAAALIYAWRLGAYGPPE
jgi:hypothetical protein